MNSSDSALQLANAVVVTPGTPQGPQARAVEALVEEIELRTRIRLPVATTLPGPGVPAVIVGRRSELAARFGETAAALPASSSPLPAEGYSIRTDRARQRVVVAGHDARGVLYAVGRLLRALRMERRRIELPLPLSVDTAPRWPLRGHQLGYRPLANSYTGWDVPQWERYIRELALWGANAIELLPPNTGGAADSPHHPLPRIEMMAAMSRIAASYGLDVWVWHPALGDDYSKPETVQAALNEWADVYSRLERVDAVFVPGGDPGHTPPALLFPLLERQIANVRRFHPKAGLWISPQGFKGDEMDLFFSYLRDSRPAWLAGVVFGPWVHIDLAEFRARIPSEYPVRYYPDITHTRHCQYPVPDWDLAFALTQGREPTCPRPEGMANILRRLQPHTCGAICYSEGAHDDVNKAVWSALSWDPAADVLDVLRDYARLFIGPSFADPFAQGLLALERNWRGALLTNDSVYATLQSFRAMEDAADPHQLKNWRFLQPLFRAYCDAYTRLRLIHETAAEEQALDALREAGTTGPETAMAEAGRILDRAVTAPVGRAWRTRIFQLAEALYQTSHHKLSVPLYQALAIGRGGHLDSLDWPLNNRLWLKERFAAIGALPKPADQLAQITELLDRTNPGPGGFYDNLGALPISPRLDRGLGAAQDPAMLRSSMVGFQYMTQEPPRERTSWLTSACSIANAPLHMSYEGLDPAAIYEVRICYSQTEYRTRIRLTANGSFEVHGFIDKPDPIEPLTFDVPPAATQTGRLRLTWEREKGRGAEGYGCSVAEVWLMRKDRAEFARIADQKWNP